MNVKLVLFIYLVSMPLCVFAMDEESTEKEKACIVSEKPDLPNALMATEQEMFDVQKKIKEYIKKGDEYLQCIALHEKGWGEEIRVPCKSQEFVLLH